MPSIRSVLVFRWLAVRPLSCGSSMFPSPQPPKQVITMSSTTMSSPSIIASNDQVPSPVKTVGGNAFGIGEEDSRFFAMARVNKSSEECAISLAKQNFQRRSWNRGHGGADDDVDDAVNEGFDLNRCEAGLF